MKAVGQGSDSSGFTGQIMAIGVPAGLVVLAGLMVLLNADESTSWIALGVLAGLAVLLVAAWQAVPVVSLVGLAAVTVLWALVGLPGSPGLLMVAPLAWIWLDRSRPRPHCLMASGFALGIALTEGIISLVTSNGTAVDLVGNTALVVLVVAIGAGLRHAAQTAPAESMYDSSGGSEAAAGEAPVAEHTTPDWVADLSGREREVLDQLVLGASNNEIAEKLHISLSTVKTHVSSILRKSGERSRYAVALALRPAPAGQADPTAEN